MNVTNHVHGKRRIAVQSCLRWVFYLFLVGGLLAAGYEVTSLRTLRPTRRFSCANLPMRPLSLSPIHLQLGNELARLRYRGLHSELLFFKAILLKSCVEG